jgi:hypothetical protein
MLNLIMKNAILLSFNLYAKEIFCKKVMPQLERKSEIVVSKFKIFSDTFFGEEKESLNIEIFPDKDFFILKERTFTWEIYDESKDETENNENFISVFFDKIFKNIERSIILFFEFDEVFFNELIFSFIPDNNNFLMPDHLNKNFKLQGVTNCLSDNKLIYICNYIFYTTRKKSYSLKTKTIIIKSNIIEKWNNSISEIMEIFNSKLENLYLVISTLLNKKNYDMRFT